MGQEKIRVVGQSQKGMALRIASGPWRILLISRWDAEFFQQQQQQENEEVHAVFLPPMGQRISDGFKEWLARVKPLLVVAPDASPELTNILTSCHTPYLDLKETGALSFKKNGSRLELRSYLKGPMGFFSYS